jgi:hypothetical protein
MECTNKEGKQMSNAAAVALFAGMIGLVVNVVWLVLGFRAVKAHEDLARASQWQSEAINRLVEVHTRRPDVPQEQEEIDPNEVLKKYQV